MAERKMTRNQQKFADEYIIDCNGSRAYREAYPHVKNDKTCRTNASRLLTNANVMTYISSKLAQISSEKTATAREVMEYLTSVMRGEETDDVWAQGGIVITVRVSHRERLRAAEMLCKRFGLLSPDVDNKEILDKLDEVLGRIDGDR